MNKKPGEQEADLPILVTEEAEPFISPWLRETANHRAAAQPSKVLDMACAITVLNVPMQHIMGVASPG